MDHQDYKRIILDQMKSVLKPRRFRKKANMFSAAVSDVLLMVQLQSSRRSTAEFLSVTVNLAIRSEPLAKQAKSISKLSVWDAHWRQRIGYLLPNPHDKWWEVRSEKEAEKCGREITAILVDKGLPLLESLSSTQNLISLWESSKSPGLTNLQREKYLLIAKSLVA